MQERHTNRKLYFEEQAYTTQKYVIPFISKQIEITPATRVLEIGCGEGGNLKPFMDLGCHCVGIDIVESQINNAREYFSDHPNFKNLELIASDIYDIQRSDFQFDVIILRDVIEHIHNQERFMDFVKRFMTANGVIFFGFPPWQNPFGGHQQICASRLSKVPYLHLLPYSLYRWVLRRGGETEGKINALIEIKDTGITIERFERIIRRNGFKMLERQLFLFNPNYEIKFGLKPRRAWPIFRSLPYLRNFYTTAGYYLLRQK